MHACSDSSCLGTLQGEGDRLTAACCLAEMSVGLKAARSTAYQIHAFFTCLAPWNLVDVAMANSHGVPECILLAEQGLHGRIHMHGVILHLRHLRQLLQALCFMPPCISHRIQASTQPPQQASRHQPGRTRP